MKIVALLLCVAATFSAAAAAPCNTTSLSQILGTGNARACSVVLGNNLMAMANPTNAQLTAACKNNDCMKAIGAVKQVCPDECTIESIRLYANIIDPLTQGCGKKPGSAGSVSASGSGAGPSVGSVSASGSGAGPSVGSVSGSGSGPLVGDAGSSGSAAKSPATSKPHTNKPAGSRAGSSSTAPHNGGANAPTLSTGAAVVVLAAVVTALL
ncbi:hypothetical protein PR003_g6361 [Phytophthora rubi]|uniref:Elicitin-like protein n=1 Tax=Phytophthora rubi TaxID=129364 RepID=A0A6A3N7V1_9STRA|nr:hypothetical protein PR002_g6383 [Phytophthora rubi]KAE9042383.1 hypothetical protein PR001_g6216 [Phytophthora rubi]KAE9348556.1 hypothetical protein PR003_g6361 [Phytophthora rubi]